MLVNFLKRWGTGSALSVIDQGLLSICNFAINIHLSRILIPKEYGIFAIIFSIYLLLLNFNQSLILEPLSIVGMTRYKEKLSIYFEKVLGLQFILSFAVSIIFFIVSLLLFFFNSELFYPILSLIITGPFICAFFLLRRFCYLLFKPQIALIGTFCYTLILTGCYSWLYTSDNISIFNVFIVFGLSSFIAAIILSWSVFKVREKNKSTVNVKIIVYKHWRLGKWLLGSSLVGWISSSIYYPLVAVFSGLEATAALKAIDNLLLPMQQVITALSLVIIPKVANQFNGSNIYLREVAIKLTGFFSGFVILYLLTIYLFKDIFIRFLYGADSTYLQFLWLLPLIGSILIARAVADLGIGVSLRIIERFDILFKTSVANSLVTVTFGIFLIWKYGILGAGVGIAVGSILQVLIAYFYFQKLFGLKKKLAC